MPRTRAKPQAQAQAQVTPEQAVAAARENPMAFLALCMGKPASGLQREMLRHALENVAWYSELPRGHAKTSTFAHLVAWWVGVRPGVRFKIIAQTDDHAVATTRFVREIVRGPVFRACFPTVKIKPGEETVSAWSVTAPGIGPRRDPTVQGVGIFGRTGGRADVLWFDDICDLRNSVLQPALRGQVKEAYANIWLPMLDPSAEHEPRLWRTATPFHTDDLTADWRREAEPAGTLLRRPCAGLTSPWPEVFTADVLEANRAAMGAMAYARAYELVPLSSDLLVFRPEWVGYYRDGEPFDRVRTVAAIDWGYSRKAQDRDDPDYSVCIVGEIDGKRRLRLTDILRVREAFPTFAKQAADLLRRRGVSAVLAEANGPQRGIFDQFATITNQPMIAVERVADKHIRAAGAQPFVQAGKLLFPADETGKVTHGFQPVLDEMLAFPAGSHDDTVDCVVDLVAEAVRGTLTAADMNVTRITKPDAITRMFGNSRTPKRPFFA